MTSPKHYVELAERQVAEAQTKLAEAQTRLTTVKQLANEWVETTDQLTDKIGSIKVSLAGLVGNNGASVDPNEDKPPPQEPPPKENKRKVKQVTHAVGPRILAINRMREMLMQFAADYVAAKAGKPPEYVKIVKGGIWVHLGDFCLAHAD